MLLSRVRKSFCYCRRQGKVYFSRGAVTGKIPSQVLFGKSHLFT